MDEGEWEVVPHTCEMQCVVIGFNHVNENGVERFETDMPRKHAIEFAVAVLNAAMELDDGYPIV